MNEDQMSFERWAVDNPELANSEVECKACEGEGRCLCLTCDHAHTCGRCGGTGMMKIGRQIYGEQAHVDRINIGKWEKALTP